MRLTSLAIAAFLSLSAALPAEAQLITYRCMFPNAPGGAIPPELVIAYDKAKNQVTVADGIILYYIKKPLAGKMITDNAKRLTVGWEMPKISNGSSQFVSALKYRATIQRSGLAISLNVIPVGYSNTFRGDGACKVV